MSLLEQDTTKRGQIDEKLANLDFDQELDAGNNKEYKIESIRNSIVYTKEAQGQLLGFYYLIF